MTIHRDLNRAGFGGNYAAWYLKELLKTAGWKVVASGSGTGGIANDPGNGDDITGTAPNMTLTDAGASFVSGMVGAFITIAGAANANDDGEFPITAVTDANNIVYTNASGVGEVGGAFTWEVHGDVFDQVDNPKINTAAISIGVGWGQEHFGNENVWYLMRHPVSNREFVLKRTNTVGDAQDGSWWMGYDPVSAYDPTTGTNINPPTAPGSEQTASSAGTRAAPSSIYASGMTATVIHIAADDVASPDGEYGFVMVEMEPTNNLSSMTILDDIRNTATGDPHALLIGHSNTTLLISTLYTGSTTPKTLFDYGGGGELWGSACYGGVNCGGGGYYPAASGVSLYDSKERPFPIPVIGTTIGGYIGISRWLQSAAVARDYPNTGDTGSPDHLYIDDVVIIDILDGVTVPVAS